MNHLEDLAGRWRTDAERFQSLGQDAPARMSQAHAEELESTLREWQMEALTLEAAATETGYSRSALERQIQRGDLTNAGSKGAPRVLRRDLPQKPSHSRPHVSTPDIADEILTRRLS